MQVNAQYRPEKPTVVDLPVSNNGARVSAATTLQKRLEHCSRRVALYFHAVCCCTFLDIILMTGKMDHLQEGLGAGVRHCEPKGNRR